MVKVRLYPDKYITVICFGCVPMLIYLFLIKKRYSLEWRFCWAYIRCSKRSIFWVFLAFYGTSIILRSFYFETLIVNLVKKLSLWKIYSILPVISTLDFSNSQIDQYINKLHLACWFLYVFLHVGFY